MLYARGNAFNDLQFLNILAFLYSKGLLSVTNERMCTNYWLTACSSLPRKSVVRLTDFHVMTIAVAWGLKQQNKQINIVLHCQIKTLLSFMEIPFF